MKLLVRYWTLLRLRFLIWWRNLCLYLAIRAIWRMTENDAQHVLTKWRWDASRVPDEEYREKLFKLLVWVEEQRKLRRQKL
jgi:hypothetical protein